MLIVFELALNIKKCDTRSSANNKVSIFYLVARLFICILAVGGAFEI